MDLSILHSPTSDFHHGVATPAPHLLCSPQRKEVMRMADRSCEACGRFTSEACR